MSSRGLIRRMLRPERSIVFHRRPACSAAREALRLATCTRSYGHLTVCGIQRASPDHAGLFEHRHRRILRRPGGRGALSGRPRGGPRPATDYEDSGGPLCWATRSRCMTGATFQRLGCGSSRQRARFLRRMTPSTICERAHPRVAAWPATSVYLTRLSAGAARGRRRRSDESGTSFVLGKRIGLSRSARPFGRLAGKRARQPADLPLPSELGVGAWARPKARHQVLLTFTAEPRGLFHDVGRSRRSTRRWP